MKTGHENVSFVYNYLLVIFWVIVIGGVIHIIVA